MATKSALTSKGSTTQWRKIRARVLKRDGHLCQMCGAVATHCDHIIPRRLGGSDSMDNLQSLCKRCNLAKGGRFFDSAKTPPTPRVLVLPQNGSLSHYQD